MIESVASAFGFINQYEQIQHLYKNNIQNLVILGCPCSDFGGQEVRDAKSLHKFWILNYGVSFPLTEKIEIKLITRLLYLWLTGVSLNGEGNVDIKQKFSKFLIDEVVPLIKCKSSASKPICNEITDWIKN